METHSADGEGSGKVRLTIRIDPYLAEQVDDCRWSDQRRITQRKIAYRAHMLLKLTGHAAALALVIAVVRARR